MTDAPKSTLQFGQTPAQFVAGWKADQTLFALGRILGFGFLLVSVLVLILQSFQSLQSHQVPIYSLFVDQSPLIRLMWGLSLVDIFALYLVQEIKRRTHLTTTRDIYTFMDAGTRGFFVQAYEAAHQNGQKLHPRLLFHLMMQSTAIKLTLYQLELAPASIIPALDQALPLIEVKETDRTYQIDDAAAELVAKSATRALDRGDRSFGLTDLFMTFLETDQEIRQFFDRLGITTDRLAVVLSWMSTKDHLVQEYHHLTSQRLHTGPVNQAWTSTPTPLLNHFGHDVTSVAAMGAVPLVSVRPKEVEEAIRILARATKNSLLLVGEPGSGKTSIVDRIAVKMLTGEVPLPLQDKRLVQLDTAALHGAPEGFATAFDQLLAETEKAGNVILFIPNLEDLASEQTSGIAAAELLLPILERERMQVIGATSMKEYREQIEPNSSFAKSFGVVEIVEMDERAAVTVLEEVALELEGRHHVMISAKALEAAVKLSAQYIHDQVLPEKAIDVVDEAAVMVAGAKRGQVTEADIREVISSHTKVPIQQVAGDEQKVLLNLEKVLHQQVVGQDEAVQAVAGALRRARAGLSNANRPIGVFLFVGPTGVGKTEVSKALAKAYFGGEEMMVRLDMSEFQGSEATATLLGQGNTEGLLTGPVRNQPFTLLLLDEFEKAADEVRNLFLSIFDDGRITDGAGHVVDFKNAIIIATSNAGSVEIQEWLGSGVAYDQICQQLTASILPKIFRPELINRFDGVIAFKPLSQGDTLAIAKLQVAAVIAQAEATSGIHVMVTAAAIQALATAGFDPVYGGRPLRRVIQDRLESPLANKILAGNLKRGDEVAMDVGDLGTNP